MMGDEEQPANRHDGEVKTTTNPLALLHLPRERSRSSIATLKLVQENREHLEPVVGKAIGEEKTEFFSLPVLHPTSEKKRRDNPWETTPPDDVEGILWDRIDNKSPAKKLIWEWCNNHQAPYGFNSQKLWDRMPQEFRDIFLKIEQEVRHVSVWDSQVTKFLFDPLADDFDFDSGVNSFALINALVLTIPYGVMATFGNSTWNDLENTMMGCPADSALATSDPGGPHQVYKNVRVMVLNNAACSVYASITGMILITWWYLFKARDRLTKWGRIKQRWHIGLIFIATTAAVVGALCLFNNIQAIFNIASQDLCQNQPLADSILTAGLVAVGAAFFGGPLLMY